MSHNPMLAVEIFSGYRDSGRTVPSSEKVKDKTKAVAKGELAKEVTEADGEPSNNLTTEKKKKRVYSRESGSHGGYEYRR